MAPLEKDVISTVFKELFTVKFLHSGYGSPRPTFIADNISIEPDGLTKKLFINHAMDYLFFNDTLVCFIRTALLSPPALEPKVPYTKFANKVTFRFLVNASTGFINITDIISAGAKNIYQFSNATNIGAGGFITMHSTGADDSDLKSTDMVKPDKTSFAVIDILSENAVNSSYDLFNNNTDQKLESPVYKILFKSRI